MGNGKIGDIYMGHSLHGNFLLKHVIEGKIEGGIEVTERRGGRRKQLLNDLKEKTVCMYVCAYMYVCMRVCIYACVRTMYVCMYLRMYVCVYVCVCIYVCMYVCICVCMYVCM